MRSSYNAFIATTCLMLVACLCVFLAIQNDDRMDWPVETEFIPMHAKPVGYWIARDYLIADRSPDLVVFGDSQLGGLRSADAKEIGRKLDFALDHRSYSIERKLAAQAAGQIKTFIASQPGSLISDFYVMARSLFRQGKVPKAVVIAVTPRSFLSNGLAYPGDSQYYRYFAAHARLHDLDKVAYTNMGNKLHAFFKNKARLPVELVEPGQFEFLPDDPQKYSDRINLYPSNFEFDLAHCQHQIRCLDEMISYLGHNGIACTVVAMPLLDKQSVAGLRKLNEQLIGILQANCRNHEARFINISNDQRFTQEDFLDPVHLSQSGGEKLSEIIAGSVINDSAYTALFKTRQLAGVKADATKLMR